MWFAVGCWKRNKSPDVSLLYVFSQGRSISKHRKSTVFFFSLASFFPIFATSDDQGSK